MNDSAARFLQMAVDLAIDNVRAQRGGPFGAVLVRGEDELVCVAVNEVTALIDPTAHAELQAIRAGARSLRSFTLEECTLFASCEPCPMCLGAIYWARLGAVYYAATRLHAASAGFDDAMIYAEMPLPPVARSLSMRQVILDTAAQPFEEWRKWENRVRY